ncbi:hemolysin, partial [cyanobacterium TDX16]
SRLELLDVSASAEEVVQRITTSPRSRYPVVDGSADRVLGVVHVKDVIRAEQAGDVVLGQLVRPLPVVSATTTAERLLAMFKEDRTHACLVVDEAGSTLGFVTLDDVVAEVVDDHVLAGSHAIEEDDDGSFVLDGEVTLADVEERLGVELTHPEVNTVAGLVLAEHGTVPEEGATVVVGGVDLVVEEVRGVKVTRVRLRRRPPAP